MPESKYGDASTDVSKDVADLYVYMEFRPVRPTRKREPGARELKVSHIDPIAIGRARVSVRLLEALTAPDTCTLELCEHADGGVSAYLISNTEPSDEATKAERHRIPVDTQILRESNFPHSFSEFALFLVGVGMVGQTIAITTSTTPPTDDDDARGKPTFIG